MTREEAIRALTIQLEYWEQLKEKNVLTDHEGNNVVDVLKMAIEALQAEPITRCKECKHHRLCNEDTHLIACGYEWCAWWQRPVISTGYCHCGARMD